MKSSIPAPLFILIIVLVVIGLGVFLWRKAGPSSSSQEAAEIARSLKSNRPDLPTLTPQQASEGATMMGGPRKGR